MKRLAPGRTLPPYGYVPGRYPHPQRDPEGHSFGLSDERFGASPDVDDWTAHEMWLYVLDLFNAGYYWEAHEGLEAWWRVSDVDDPRRALFQGLLRLAAAGVKAREGRPGGVRKHAARAAELLAGVAADRAGDARLLGLDPVELRAAAVELADGSHEPSADADSGDARPVLGIELHPQSAGEHG